MSPRVYMYIPELKREVRPEYINGLIGFIDFTKDVTKTDSIFDISEAFRHTETNKLAIEYIKSQPGVGQLVEERYLATTPDLEALLKLPKDSLGYIYAYNMKQANFNPEFYRKVQVADDMTYLILRQRQTHDIWHTVTGFGTDAPGELGLQGFTLAQTHGPLSVAIMAGGILNTLLHASEHLTYILNKIGQGYNLGIKAKPFLAQKWEENWEKPLAEWRAELGVEAVN